VETLCALFAAALSRDAVAPDDDFFELGGDSLMAGSLLLRIKDAFDLDTTLRTIFASSTPRALAAALASPPEAQGARYVIFSSGLRVRVQTPAEARYFYDSIFEDNCYFRHGVHLTADPIVLDVGANIGLFSILVGRMQPNARILSFEPAPPIFSILCENLDTHCQNARGFAVGLGARPGAETLRFYPESSGMSSFGSDVDRDRAALAAILRNQGELAKGDGEDYLTARMRYETHECALTTVSDVVRQHGLERIDLMKVDVQHLELAVLRGIAPEHWPRIRQLVIEVHDIEGRLRDVGDLLTANGFSVVEEQDPLYRGAGVFNVFAVRSEQL
jgi:FkbM family methyltransferase